MNTPRPLVTGLAATALKHTCHALHLILVFYGLLGWLVPDSAWLVAHLLFMPGLILTWLLNKGVCPLNNLETFLTTGIWRDEGNPEEGGFLRVLVERYLGLNPTQGQMDAITYGLMAGVWGLSWVHLAIREGVFSPS